MSWQARSQSSGGAPEKGRCCDLSAGAIKDDDATCIGSALPCRQSGRSLWPGGSFCDVDQPAAQIALNDDAQRRRGPFLRLHGISRPLAGHRIEVERIVCVRKKPEPITRQSGSGGTHPP